jgi:hypothetical protein
MREARTLVHPELEFCEQSWTATEVLRPAAALIDTRPWVGVLLAKDSEPDANGTVLRTVLRAARWVRLPRGWRWVAMKDLSRLRPLRLPPEWIFNEVRLTTAADGSFVARLDDDPMGGRVLPSPRSVPYPVKQLTGGQYRRMAEASGRRLREQVVSLFSEELAGERGEGTFCHWDVAGEAKWRVFAG